MLVPKFGTNGKYGWENISHPGLLYPNHATDIILSVAQLVQYSKYCTNCTADNIISVAHLLCNRNFIFCCAILLLHIVLYSTFQYCAGFKNAGLAFLNPAQY